MIRRSDAPADTVKVTSLPQGLGLRLADGARSARAPDGSRFTGTTRRSSRLCDSSHSSASVPARGQEVNGHHDSHRMFQLVQPSESESVAAEDNEQRLALPWHLAVYISGRFSRSWKA